MLVCPSSLLWGFALTSSFLWFVCEHKFLNLDFWTIYKGGRSWAQSAKFSLSSRSWVPSRNHLTRQAGCVQGYFLCYKGNKSIDPWGKLTCWTSASIVRPCLRNQIESQRDGSMGKSICRSSRRPESGSSTHMMAHNHYLKLKFQGVQSCHLASKGTCIHAHIVPHGHIAKNWS